MKKSRIEPRKIFLVPIFAWQIGKSQAKAKLLVEAIVKAKSGGLVFNKWTTPEKYLRQVKTTAVA